MIARTPVSAPLKLILSSRLGLVSVPSPGASFGDSDGETAFDRNQAGELLESLGRNLGMTLLEAAGNAFPEGDEADAGTFPDAAVRKALEALDVVWMAGGEAVAAFVLETGMGRGEGIRRFADLLALHPKLKAPLYAVTLPAGKRALLEEIHRPVYRLLKKPLGESVRLLEWDRLESEVRGLGERVRYLKAEFLEGISEVVEPPSGD
jgi:hypothetical protein